MGKPKKGTKNRQDEDFGDDDVDLDPLANTKNDEDAPVTKSKKGKKGKKKKDDDWEEDVAAEIKALSIADGENEDEPAKQKKQKKPAVSAFAMLDIEEPDSEEDSADEEINKPPPKNQPKPKGSENNDVNELEKAATKNAKQKKGKKDKNRQQEADEDLDALLAEIEKPVEKTQGKKKKKKKGGAQEDEENALNAEEGGETVEDASAEVEEKMEEIKAMTAEDLYPDSDEDKKKKKKKGKKQKEESNVEEEDDGEKVEGGDDEDEGPTVKTAAQKKKEKKEREKKAKQEKAAKKAKGGSKDDVEKPAESKEGSAEPAATTEPSKEDSVEPDAAKAKEGEDEGSDEEDGEKKSKKDKKKKKKDKAEKGEKKKKPANAQIKAMQEALQKMKEEEERLEREEDERIKREEEAERLREEKKKLDEERREKKKQKEKERKERLKKEGKLLTDKQKQDMKRAQQMLEMMEAQGIKVPQREQTGEKKRVVYGRQRKKKSDSDVQESTPTPEVERSPSVEVKTPTEEEPAQEKEPAASWDADEEEVKDDWDKSDDEAPEDGKTAESKAEEVVTSEKVEEDEEEEDDEDEEEEDEESDEESDEDSEEDSDEESESDDDEDLTPAERAGLNIMKRKEAAEKKRDINVLRSPVVCVLGHVDTGKTKILDKLRRTNVQDGEAGGITQQIGATNVPLEAIKTQTRMCKDFLKFDLKLPGLLIIDTPGHESFSNLRSRGSSLCDIAILVIDIMHGLEPQTIESIELLKSRKTPFIVALNKVDRLFGWKPNPHQDVKLVINKQQPNTKLEFEERTKEVIVQLSEQGLNSALYYNNKNVREYVSLVPTSAHSGDGMGSLVALICELTQTLLAKRISFVETLEATVMEVKALPGLGTTVDVILVNGVLREGDTIILPGTEGPISTQVRGLLMPQPMKELRVKNAYEKHKEVHAAQGVKLIAKDMEKALAGLPMYVAHNQDEVEYYKEELSQSLKDVLNSIKLTPSGVYVQASTLGSLEALLEFLRTSKIPYSGINIGPVHKKDVMKASVMLEHDSQYACILAFDVKVEREAQEMAENLGVKVFTAEIIYHLFDQFTKYQEDLRLKKKEEFKHIAVFPCKLRVLPNCIFNTRDPIILGVSVEAGCIKEGSPLCVPSKEFVEIGRISSLEVNHKQVDVARKGMEVCIKIENTSGDAPKLYGRHFDHTDLLVSKISRESIDALKDYFRDEMTKADWALVVDLKKKFEIM